MTTNIDKLIHKVNSSAANLTRILTNGIAYQFVYKILIKDEYVHCTMSENTATLLNEPLVLVPFILKLCNVWQYFLLLHSVLKVTSQGLELFTRNTSTKTLK